MTENGVEGKGDNMCECVVWWSYVSVCDRYDEKSACARACVFVCEYE